MCDDYQEILKLRGFGYNAAEAGNFRDGYGVVSNTVFAVNGNEDFSHDLVHYYSKKVNRNRNWIAEEGFAYTWGNAYYTDKDGKTIDHGLLLQELKKYLEHKSKKDFFWLFVNNTNIYDHIASEISVRYVIAGLIVGKIEKKYPQHGVRLLINAGSKDQLDAFLQVTDSLIGLNRANFDKKVKKLLKNH